MYQSVNPTTEEIIASYPEATDQEIDQALDGAMRGFELWKKLPVRERVQVFSAAASVLESRQREIATVMAQEMGKPIAQGIAEAQKCGTACRYFAEHAEDFLSPRIEAHSESFVQYAPLGPVLAIMPWNFPFWQLFRFALPALAAGNSVVMKHSPNTPQCALAIVDVWKAAGLPPAVFQSLFLSNTQSSRVIGDLRIRAVTLTGSTRAGQSVAETAGRHLKKVVLELGGNDPFIVFQDVDVELTAKLAVSARCINSGQSCIAAKRFFVQEGIVSDFMAAFVREMQAQVLGDPLDERTTVGPLARGDLRETLAAQVVRARATGANLVIGGSAPNRRGFFFAPTLLEFPKASKQAGLFDEELFGPVASLYSFEDEQQAVTFANRTSYGLGASVWTHDRVRALRIADALDAGSVFLNTVVKSDPRFPFGGVKLSGYGRELGREGMLEFVNIKTIGRP